RTAIIPPPIPHNDYHLLITNETEKPLIMLTSLVYVFPFTSNTLVFSLAFGSLLFANLSRSINNSKNINNKNIPKYNEKLVVSSVPFNQVPKILPGIVPRSEEHTSELQSRFDLVCRLLLEKKKNK